jgi:hypothetical protein
MNQDEVDAFFKKFSLENQFSHPLEMIKEGEKILFRNIMDIAKECGGYEYIGPSSEGGDYGRKTGSNLCSQHILLKVT